MLKPETHDKILNVTLNMYFDGDAEEKVTMEEIAQRAQVGRATLYRHFKNRDDLLISVMEREARQIAVEIEAKLIGIEDAGEHIVEGMVQAVLALRDSNLFSKIISPSGTSMHRLLFTSDRLSQVGLEIMLPLIHKAGLRDDLDIDSNVLMEWVLRILVSLITIPSPATASEDGMRTMLRQLLIPVIDKPKIN